MFTRQEYNIIKKRLEEPRKFIQVVMGPRQVGKSTVVKQVLKDIAIPHLLFLADDVPASNRAWISIQGWSEIVKKEWDMDSYQDVPVKVLLLGSSRVLLEKGLADSMAGRYEEIRMGHWSYAEMRDAFGWSLDQYVFYGGYPGSATLIEDEDRWSDYVQSAIVDATINKDILQNTVITKPALLKQTFELASAYSGEIVSLTKMLGQLQDAGNTTTLAGYINLLSQSGLVGGLQKVPSVGPEPGAVNGDYERSGRSVESGHIFSFLKIISHVFGIMEVRRRDHIMINVVFHHLASQKVETHGYVSHFFLLFETAGSSPHTK